MKRILPLLFTLILVLSSSGNAQVSWLTSEKLAKAIAAEKDQLILMDFWATWCGPCKKMDSDMWDTEEFKVLSENFVAFKIDIDLERGLAATYNIRSIPHVVLATASGDIIWERTGYSHSSPYKKVLENLPKSLNGLNLKLLELGEEYEDDEYFSIAEEYFKLALGSIDDLKNGFLTQSDKYLKEITKNSENEEKIALAEMKMLLNDAYQGRYKRAIRKVDKMEAGKNKELADMKQFIKAYCFKCEGNVDSFEKAKAK